VTKSRECFTQQTLAAAATDADVSICWLTLGGAQLELASDVALLEQQTLDVNICRKWRQQRCSLCSNRRGATSGASPIDACDASARGCGAL
jgi:hypothetical protein